MPKIVDKEQKRIEIARKAMPLLAKYGFENTPIRRITAGKHTIRSRENPRL